MAQKQVPRVPLYTQRVHVAREPIPPELARAASAGRRTVAHIRKGRPRQQSADAIDPDARPSLEPAANRLVGKLDGTYASLPAVEVDDPRPRPCVENQPRADSFALAVAVDDDHIEELDIVPFDFEGESPEPAVVSADADRVMLSSEVDRSLAQEDIPGRHGHAGRQTDGDKSK